MPIEDAWTAALRDAARELWKFDPPGTLLDAPSDPRFGDAVCNLPLRLAKELKQPPRALAEALAAQLRRMGVRHLAKVEVAGAGFVNLHGAPELCQDELKRILAEGDAYGRSTAGGGRRVLIEHCSANPTGPLHIAHGRNAAVGDALANLLDFAGFKVSREFYVNDTGNQIEMLGRSILWRMAGDPEPPDPNCYRGEYVKELAEELRAGCCSVDARQAADFGKRRLLEAIQQDLSDFRVSYDTWYSQEELERSGKVEALLNFYTSWGLTYEKEGAVWLKTKDLGDADDKVLVKSDKTYAYRTPDLAYHRDKFERGFDIVIDLWGPDHHAHIATMQAGLKALNYNLVPLEKSAPSRGATPETRPVTFQVLIVQHCRLLKGGQEVKMSKRAASYVTLRELMDEVGVDATRFFFIMRKTDSHLDFDMDLAVKQEKDNPYYYAGYAHARICNIFLKGIEEKKIDPADVKYGTWRGTFDATKAGPDEIEILKAARQLQRRVDIAARDLDPATLTEFLRELSGAFQRYYELGNRDSGKRVLCEDEALRRARLAACAALQQVLRNTFRLLGLSAPEKM